MEIIKAPIYVKLTEEERKTLRDAYDILNELYDVIHDNDCEYVSDTCGNGYDRVDVALTANVLQMLAPTNDLANDPLVCEATFTTHKTIVFKKGE